MLPLGPLTLDARGVPPEPVAQVALGAGAVEARGVAREREDARDERVERGGGGGGEERGAEEGEAAEGAVEVERVVGQEGEEGPDERGLVGGVVPPKGEALRGEGGGGQRVGLGARKGRRPGSGSVPCA